MVLISGIIIIVVLGIGITGNIINNINISTEQNRDYYINIEDKFAFDCNAEYDEDHDTLKCTGNEIIGNFSKYDTVILTGEEYSGNLNVNDSNFAVKLPRIDITEYYKIENFDEVKLKNTVKKKIETLKIYNNVLGEYVIEKGIAFEWILTEADRQLLREKNEAWKIKEAERKAREEDERRAKEEAERLEKERKAQEELQKKSAECVAQGVGYWWDGAKCNYTQPATPAPQPAPQQSPVPQSTSQSAPQQTPAPQPAPQPISQLPLKAICKDGTVSYQNDASKPDYRGMCSHHGGIQTKLGRVP